MQKRSTLSHVFALVSVGVACNAVLGLEKMEKQRPGGNGAEAGMGETGGTATGGRGGSSGSTQGGRGGTSGRGGSSGASGSAGDGGGGMGGGTGDCEPEDMAPCSTVDPSLLGNCRDGEVVCDENGTWGDCSVTAEDADSCDIEGDDADCDGTPNGMCPCINDDTRDCGPDTEDGICQLGTQTCVNEMWGDCEGAVFPEARDCLSAADNDCDGMVDNARDEVCPCAVDGAHACVEDAPVDWSGPAAIATAGGSVSSPLCSGTGYEIQVESLFGSLNEGTPNCGCACSTPTGTCGNTICLHRTSTSQQCQMAGINIGDTCEHTVNVGSCFNVTTSGYYKPMGPNWNATGTCTAQPTASIPTPSWGRRMVACETNAADPAGCTSGAQCMPELVNPLEAWCIYRDGEHDCPTGPFSARTIYNDGFTDMRSCSNCTCGSATGTCTGSVHFSYQNVQNCSGQLLFDAVGFGSCGNIDSSFGLVATPTTPVGSGSCPPMGGALQGSVTRSGAVTFCCMP